MQRQKILNNYHSFIYKFDKYEPDMPKSHDRRSNIHSIYVPHIFAAFLRIFYKPPQKCEKFAKTKVKKLLYARTPAFPQIKMFRDIFVLILAVLLTKVTQLSNHNEPIQNMFGLSKLTNISFIYIFSIHLLKLGQSEVHTGGTVYSCVQTLI